MAEKAFRVGDRVSKISGYRFDGEIRSVFTNTAGDLRCVVEMTGNSNGAGMLHIFNLQQLKRQD